MSLCWTREYKQRDGSVDAAKIILGETGALCRESDMIEVSKNQPHIAACEGCGGEGWEHCLRR